MAGMEFALMVRDWRVAEEKEFLRHRIQGEGLQTRLLRRVVMWQGCCGRYMTVCNVSRDVALCDKGRLRNDIQMVPLSLNRTQNRNINISFEIYTDHSKIYIFHLKYL